MRLRPAAYLFSLIVLWTAGCGVGAPASTESPSPQVGSTATPIATALPPTSSPTRLIPSPSPTPPPPDFTETFDTLPPHWSFVHVESGQLLAGPVARDGFLVFELPAANEWGYAVYQGRQYTDVTIDAQTQYRTSGDGSAGIVCRYDEHVGWYELDVFQDQTYQLLFGQWLSPGVARYTPLYRDQSTKIQTDANELGLECKGSALTPVINGVRLHQYQEQKFALQEGAIGLAASSFADAPARIAFDSVKVSGP